VHPDADVYPIAEALAGSAIHPRGLARDRPRLSRFHAEHPDRAVADHMPALLDAVIGVLQRSAATDGVQAPMDDPAVVQAATEHARARFEQGLGPVAVVTEFRLLRHEIGRALIDAAADAPAADLLAGQAIVDDALDGACTVGSIAVVAHRDAARGVPRHDPARCPPADHARDRSLDLAQRWLHDAEPDTAKVAEVVGDAVLAVTEINAMLDTLGDATRVAMGSVESNTEPASLEAIVEEALALLGHDARARIQVDAPAARA
jgi:hypothetical protein